LRVFGNFVTLFGESQKKKMYLCLTKKHMDRDTFEKQKPFAGEKKPSMLRRCVDNDYTARRMYMVTMVTEGRKPLFGRVAGNSMAIEPSREAPHIDLSPLGMAIEEIWLTIGYHHPEIKVVALQMMPDHLRHPLRSRKDGKAIGKSAVGREAGLQSGVPGAATHRMCCCATATCRKTHVGMRAT